MRMRLWSIMFMNLQQYMVWQMVGEIFVRTLSSIQKEMIDTIQRYINAGRFRYIA